jgi:hypothetical protein
MAEDLSAARAEPVIKSNTGVKANNRFMDKPLFDKGKPFPRMKAVSPADEYVYTAKSPVRIRNPRSSSS